MSIGFRVSVCLRVCMGGFLCLCPYVSMRLCVRMAVYFYMHAPIFPHLFMFLRVCGRLRLFGSASACPCVSVRQWVSVFPGLSVSVSM